MAKQRNYNFIAQLLHYKILQKHCQNDKLLVT